MSRDGALAEGAHCQGCGTCRACPRPARSTASAGDSRRRRQSQGSAAGASCLVSIARRILPGRGTRAAPPARLRCYAARPLFCFGRLHRLRHYTWRGPHTIRLKACTHHSCSAPRHRPLPCQVVYEELKALMGGEQAELVQPKYGPSVVLMAGLQARPGQRCRCKCRLLHACLVAAPASPRLWQQSHLISCLIATPAARLLSRLLLLCRSLSSGPLRKPSRLPLKHAGWPHPPLAPPQGTGKTTAAGKLALYMKKRGMKVLLVATDVYRPGKPPPPRGLLPAQRQACSPWHARRRGTAACPARKGPGGPSLEAVPPAQTSLAAPPARTCSRH